ncbi:hypothetical protein ES703_109943 [subsurface metagenome]
MPDKEWEKLKEALREAPTEEARKAAAEAFRRHEQAKARPKSRPTLVSLGFKKKYPTSIDVKDIPGELERNPAFFEHLRDIVEAD